MNISLLKIMFLSFCFLGLAGFTSSDIHSGAKVKVGQGEASVYIELDSKSHKPMNLGIEFTGGCLQGLDHMDQEFPLPLPTTFKLAPYQHVIMNWNPHGHFPNDIYGVPHFDFHFYFISSADREKILCDASDVNQCLKMPTEKEAPPYFVPSPDGVPKMGWHWVDSRAPELNGKTFTTTFIYGYYGGKMIFVEPMMTQLFLMSKAPFTQALSVPAQMPVAGYYARKYGLSYDSPRDVFRVTLQNLFYSSARP